MTGVILLQDQEGTMMTYVRRLEQASKHLVGLDQWVTTVPLERTHSGTVYFVYQCTRYVYQAGRFVPHTVDLGYSCADLAQLTHGLDDSEAAHREELMGPNFIQVHVPSFLMALLMEFTSFFYIYQFTVLWLFYYYAYCKFAEILALILTLYSSFTVGLNRASGHCRYVCDSRLCYCQGRGAFAV
jgi:cation-transporting ATPase 13A3/4/5